MSSRESTREQYATSMLGLKNAAGRSIGSEIASLAWYVETYVASLEAERDELKKLINESPKVWLDSSSYRDPLNSRLTFMRVYEEEQSPTSDAPFRYAMVMLDEKRPRVADLDEEGFDL